MGESRAVVQVLPRGSKQAMPRHEEKMTPTDLSIGYGGTDMVGMCTRQSTHSRCIQVVILMVNAILPFLLVPTIRRVTFATAMDHHRMRKWDPASCHSRMGIHAAVSIVVGIRRGLMWSRPHASHHHSSGEAETIPSITMLQQSLWVVFGSGLGWWYD